MPDLPITTNVNITRIDAPFPEQWSAELSGLVGELKEIKDLMTVVALGVTQSKDVQAEVLKLYSKEGFAERASMAEAVNINEGQQRPVNAQGQAEGQSRAPGSLNLEAPPGTPGAERQRAEEGGASRARTPYEESLEALGQNSSLMPQHFGGRYTAADLLNLMAKGTKRLNERRNPEINEWGEPVEGGMEGTRLARTTNKLSELARSTVPNLQAGINLGKSYYSAATGASESLGSYSGSLGYEAGGGFLGTNSVSGPFGTNFRLPFINSAALSGAGDILEAYGTAMSYPGLSGTQVMAMNQSLAERGWFPGQKGQQELFDAQAHLISKGGQMQQLGESPEVQELMDRGMRTGQASMEEMVATIEEIPEAAKNAHESVSQMVQSMNEIGEFSQSQGGTHYAGQQQALELAHTTGMPVQATKGLLESPWATSAIFRATGTPSWMQGILPGAIKNRVATNSFWQLANSVGKGEGRTYKVGNFTEHISGIEEQAARLHMLMPQMNPETILRMLRMGKAGTRGRSKVEEELGAWGKLSGEVMGSSNAKGLTDAERERLQGVENQLLTANNVGPRNFGRILHDMAQIKTAQGNRMFSQQDIKEIRTNFGSGYNSHGEKLMKEKEAAVNKILSRKAGKDANAAGSPGNVVLELSPAARRLLQLPNKKTRIKLEAGAGENQTNNSVAGYSDSLLPNEMNAQERAEHGFGTAINPTTGEEEATAW